MSEIYFLTPRKHVFGALNGVGINLVCSIALTIVTSLEIKNMMTDGITLNLRQQMTQSTDQTAQMHY